MTSRGFSLGSRASSGVEWSEIICIVACGERFAFCVDLNMLIFYFDMISCKDSIPSS